MIKKIIRSVIPKKYYNRWKYHRCWKRFDEDFPEISNELKKNIEFKNKHIGERVFVLGNGPSLQAQDLSLLEKEYVITVNEASRLKQFASIKPNYHVVIDGNYTTLDLNKQEDAETFDALKGINTDSNRPILFYTISGFDFAKDNGLEDIFDMRYINFFYDFYEEWDLPIDFTKIVPCFTTVVQMGILLAMYMGFAEIYCLGCDCTDIFALIKGKDIESNDIEYAYDVTTSVANRYVRNTSDIPREDYLLAFYHRFRDYRLLYEMCKQRKIKLFNATAGGVLDAMPRIEYKSLF